MYVQMHHSNVHEMLIDLAVIQELYLILVLMKVCSDNFELI